MKNSYYIFLAIGSLVAFTVKLHAMNTEKVPLLQPQHGSQSSSAKPLVPTYVFIKPSQYLEKSDYQDQIEKIIKDSSISPASQEIKGFSTAYKNQQQKWPLCAAIKNILDSRGLLIPIKVKTIKNDNMVVSVALSSNGKFVALGLGSPTLKIVNTETDEFFQFTADTHLDLPIITSALSPDGRYMAFSYALSQRSFIWDCLKKKEIAVLIGHEAVITSITIPDTETVYTLSMDNTIRKWNLHTGECLAICHCSKIVNSSLSSTGRYYATINHKDNSINIFDHNADKTSNLPTASTGTLYSVAVSQRADRIIIGEDTVAKIYDVQAGRCLYAINCHNNKVYSVAISADDRFIATGSADTTATIWDLAWYQDLSFEQLISIIKVIDSKHTGQGFNVNEWKNVFKKTPVYIQQFLKTI